MFNHDQVYKKTVHVWFRFECYTLFGYKARTMSHQTAPNHLLQSALPNFVWQHYLHHFEGNCGTVKLSLPKTNC
jgi:hypothetical protein